MQFPQVLFPYLFFLTLQRTRVMALEPILSVAFSSAIICSIVSVLNPDDLLEQGLQAVLFSDEKSCKKNYL